MKGIRWIGLLLSCTLLTGCRNVLLVDQPSRLCEVHQLQQFARTGWNIDQSSIVQCRGPMQNARELQLDPISPITTGPQLRRSVP